MTPVIRFGFSLVAVAVLANVGPLAAPLTRSPYVFDTGAASKPLESVRGKRARRRARKS